ncbi:hypothetical protein V6N12_011775 [Hibiscus sabdariffa]|uniref:Uncharacterized protein n=1 Tax=Hibiscus sabdariffa TaxID=183260 RepID=A0ABR2BTI1_9ROSI
MDMDEWSEARVFPFIVGYYGSRVAARAATSSTNCDKLQPTVGRTAPRSHVGVPPAAVADLVAEEQRHWGERLIVDTESNSHCRRVDPRG